MDTNVYGRRERVALWALAAVGFFGVNGLFLYGLVLRPGSLQAALANPVSLGFMIEALLLLCALAYLLSRWGVNRMSAGWFVVLSLIGGIAFGLPVVLLWAPKKAG